MGGNWDESARVGTTACVRPRARGRRASREQGGLTGHGCLPRSNQSDAPAGLRLCRSMATCKSGIPNRVEAGRLLGWWLGAMRLANRHTRMGRGHQPRRVANQRTRTWLLACSSQVRTARAECFAETTTRQRPQTTRTRTHDGKSSSSRPCRRRRLRAFPVMAA